METAEFKTKKSAETFARVIETAARLFQEKGFDATTMRDISRESGLGLGALYYYFRTKEELVLKFYAQNSQEGIARFREKSEPLTSLPDAVAAFLHDKIASLTPYRSFLRVVMREAVDSESPLSPLGPASREYREANIALFQEMVERSGTAKGKEARLLAQGLWLAHLNLLLYWLHDRSENFTATGQAIQTFAAILRLTTMVSRIPGLGTIRRQVLGLIDDLLVHAQDNPERKLP